MSKLSTKLFTSSGTWVAPAGVTQIILRGIGAGGGGGGGGGGDVNVAGAGGAGGGGAQQGRAVVTVIPGVTYNVNVGLGGVFGAGGGNTIISGPGGNGSDGQDTTFAAPGPTTLATFRGADGCFGGQNATEANVSANGGQPVKGLFIAGCTNCSGGGHPFNPGQGGYGVARGSTQPSAARNGAGTSVAVGGASGSLGANAARNGGGSGGGGGASTWTGNIPGNGGTGTPGFGSVTPGSAGTAGTFGAGGGGGGGGGGTINGQPLRAGLAGGIGGNGALEITWVE